MAREKRATRNFSAKCYISLLRGPREHAVMRIALISPEEAEAMYKQGDGDSGVVREVEDDARERYRHRQKKMTVVNPAVTA